MLAIVLILGVGATNYYSEKRYVQTYNAIKTTIETARTSNVSDVERAALTVKIIEVNQHLADDRYWKDSIWGVFYPDEVVKLEFLK